MEFTAAAQALRPEGPIVEIASPERRAVVKANQEPGQSGPWTTQVTETMRAICDGPDAPSASRIAMRLNECFEFADGLVPMTRNAVIGKCHRMGISLNTTRPASAVPRAPKAPKPPRQRPARQARQGESDSRPGAIASLSAHRNDARKEILALSAAFDAFHQSSLDAYEAQFTADVDAPVRTIAEIAAGADLAPEIAKLWPENRVPLPLHETTDCHCRYTTSRSSSGMHHFCGATRASHKDHEGRTRYVSSFCPTHHAVSHQRGN